MAAASASEEARADQAALEEAGEQAESDATHAVDGEDLPATPAPAQATDRDELAELGIVDEVSSSFDLSELGVVKGGENEVALALGQESADAAAARIQVASARDGSSAAAEAAPFGHPQNEETHAAATRIQAVHRGRSTRSMLASARAGSSAVAEAAHSGYPENEETHAAATRIQAVHRGRSTRNMLALAREGAGDAEVVYFEHAEDEETYAAATRIQSVYRGRRSRNMLSALRESTCTAEAASGGRADQDEDQESAAATETHIKAVFWGRSNRAVHVPGKDGPRAAEDSSDDCEWDEDAVAAATYIQAIYRGCCTRAMLDADREAASRSSDCGSAGARAAAAAGLEGCDEDAAGDPRAKGPRDKLDGGSEPDAFPSLVLDGEEPAVAAAGSASTIATTTHGGGSVSASPALTATGGGRSGLGLLAAASRVSPRPRSPGGGGGGGGRGFSPSSGGMTAFDPMKQLLNQRLFGNEADVLSPGCCGSPFSLSSGTPSPQQQHQQQLLQAPGSPRGGAGAQQRKLDPKVCERLYARKERRNGRLSPEHTFRPTISAASQKLDKHPKNVARWQVLAEASESKEKKLAELTRMRDERQMKECVFHPTISKQSEDILKNSGKVKRWHDCLKKEAKADGAGGGEEDGFGEPSPIPATPTGKPSSPTRKHRDTLLSSEKLMNSHTAASLEKHQHRFMQPGGKAAELSDPLFDDLHRLLMSIRL